MQRRLIIQILFPWHLDWLAKKNWRWKQFPHVHSSTSPAFLPQDTKTHFKSVWPDSIVKTDAGRHTCLTCTILYWGWCFTMRSFSPCLGQVMDQSILLAVLGNTCLQEVFFSMNSCCSYWRQTVVVTIWECWLLHVLEIMNTQTLTFFYSVNNLNTCIQTIFFPFTHKLIWVSSLRYKNSIFEKVQGLKMKWRPLDDAH